MDIGRWSEEFIYKLLKEDERFSEIIWENEIEESMKPYDFKVIENGITKYIEVKVRHHQLKTLFIYQKMNGI